MVAVSPVPALPDAERRTAYAPAGSAGPFNVGFALYGDGTDYQNWIEVFLNGVLQSPTAYTLSSPTGPIGSIPLPITDAQVTFNSAVTGDLEIVGARRPRRQAQFSENRGVSAHDLNVLMTEIEATARETWDRFGRVPQCPPGETMAVLPAKAARAGLPASFNSNGDLIPFGVVPPTAVVSAAMIPVLDAATLAAARQILGVQGTGVYACSATYGVNAGIGQYALTTTDLSPVSLQDGMRFRFVAPATADTGQIAIQVVGLSGYLSLLSADGGFTTFFDVSQGEPVTVEYDAAAVCFKRIFGVRSQVHARDGSFNIAANGFGVGTAVQQITIQPSNGQGGFLLLNPGTQSFRMCRLSGGFTRSLFTPTGPSPLCYVNGVANGVALADTFHYVYLFNSDANNSFAVEVDLVPVVIGNPTTKHPTRGELGFDVMNGDPSRRFAGMFYTLNGGVGFVGAGVTPQLLVHSMYDSTNLPVQSSDVSHSPAPSGAFEDIPNSAISVCFSAISFLPKFSGDISNAVGSAAGFVRLHLAGVAVSEGVATAFDVTSTGREIAAGTSAHVQYGQALSDGFVKSVLQCKIVAGSASFHGDQLCDAWQ